MLFFPPIGPPDGPRGDWPQRVRAELEARRLFDMPGYPRHVPTSDGLHPTPEGHAILAAHWTEALRRAGLSGVTTRTFLRERPNPLGLRDIEHVIDRFTRWVDRLRPTGYLEPADLQAWDRLLDPADPAWLGHRSDLFSLVARSVHVGELTD